MERGNKALLIAPSATVLERFNRMNLRALEALDCRIHLAANFSSDNPVTEERLRGFARAARAAGWTLHPLPFRRATLRRNLRPVLALRALLERERFRLVHAQTETGGLLTRLALGGGGGPTRLYTPHGMSFYRGGPLLRRMVYGPAERWICGGMDFNVAVNREEYEWLCRWDRRKARLVHGSGLDAEAIEAVSGGREEARRRWGIPRDAVAAVSVGELTANKNHRVVLEALTYPETAGIYYVVCGDGPLRGALEWAARVYGLEGCVRLTGYRGDVADLLRAADLFVQPSFHEGLPMALLEAMAAGLPAVCSRIRGNTDLIGDAEGGYLADPGDARQFARCLGVLAASPDVRGHMGRVNLERVRQYSDSVVLDELTALYKEALDDGRSGRQYYFTGL